MRVRVVVKQAPPDTRAYAEQKLSRLERHAPLHDVSLTVRRDISTVPQASAEVVMHLHHTRLAARCEASSVREAIDGAVERADAQVRRRQERVRSHRGQMGAGAPPPRP
jgi:ribosomal subunit interface protein